MILDSSWKIFSIYATYIPKKVASQSQFHTETGYVANVSNDFIFGNKRVYRICSMHVLLKVDA
jgi:hypothetical protein